MTSKLTHAVVAGLALAASASAQEWEHFPMPQPGPYANPIIFSADAVADDLVWAVGSYDEVDPSTFIRDTQTFTALFDGTSWKQVPSPSPGLYRDIEELWGVVALSADDIFAVGVYEPTTSTTSQTFFIRYDGSSWRQEDSPLITGGSGFYGIGRAGGDIWAVGSHRSSEPPPAPGNIALAARWTGSGWEQFPVPPLGQTGGRTVNLLQAVDGVSTDDAWAVGTADEAGTTGGFPPTAYITHWNGSAWSLFDLGTRISSGLYDVLALAEDDVWAVGQHTTASGRQPLIMHYDGSSWQSVDVPVFPDGRAELRAITARSPGELYASGTNATSAGVPRALIMKYDGVGWTEMPAASHAGEQEWFRAMTTTPGGDVWAFGQYHLPSPESLRALAERLPADSRCYADCDGSGGLDFFDFLCFQNQFAAGDPAADCDDSGSLDFFDFLCFQNEFAAGCP